MPVCEFLSTTQQPSAGFVTHSPSFGEYLRVKLVFEAARAGGYWNFLWDITRKPPSSKAIWSQLASLGSKVAENQPTAVAECDELSAMFAFLARKLGVHNVGLVWQVVGHTVAVWRAPKKGGGYVKVVVPTSQVFLDEKQSLVTKMFRTFPPKRFRPYRAKDVAMSLLLSRDVVHFFLQRARRYGA